METFFRVLFAFVIGWGFFILGSHVLAPEQDWWVRILVGAALCLLAQATYFKLADR